MLIPLRCDAPLYHRPWGTLGLMALCTVLHITVGRSDAVDDWVLVYGHWNPLQWITSVLVHDGWMHLIGNMVFLWVFGLIVEGKVGWWRFLLVVLGISLVSCGIEQTAMLGATGASLGFSGVLFGLMAMAWLWAPENEVDVILFLPPIVRHFEWSVQTLGWIFLGREVLFFILDGFAVGSALLHLLGAVVGAPLGYVMLRKQWVECEGWDVLSRRQQQQAPSPSRLKGVQAQTPYPPIAPVASLPVVSVGELLSEGRLDEAMAACRANPAAVDPALLQRLAAKLVEVGRWQDAESIADLRLRGEPEHVATRLMKAWALVQMKRPSAALEVLEGLQVTADMDRQRYARIRAEAERSQAENPYEFA